VIIERGNAWFVHKLSTRCDIIRRNDAYAKITEATLAETRGPKALTAVVTVRGVIRNSVTKGGGCDVLGDGRG